MNRVEIVLLTRETVSRRRALNSPLRQGSAELVQYFADFTPWGATSSLPVTSPVLKVLDQDGVDVTYGGHVTQVSVNAAGSGYSVDDVLTLVESGSSGDCTAKVLTVGGSGEVETFYSSTPTTPGYNYTVGSKETTGGGGSGCTILISTVTDAELVVKASAVVANDTQIQFNLTNVVAGDRYRVFIKGTVNSLIEECWLYLDGEL